MEQGVVLTMRNISKNFPGVKALQNVDFTLRKGEIHAVMGENGAGKSTLIKEMCIRDRGIKNTISLEKEGLEFVGDAGDGELAYPLILKTQPDIF